MFSRVATKKTATSSPEALSPAMAESAIGDTPITLHATGTPLMDILSVLSEKSGLNIVASTDVETREISIHLTDTPVEEALNLIVRAAGLGYEKIGDSMSRVYAETVERFKRSA